MGILTLKRKAVIPSSAVGNAVNVAANADGAVIVKDSSGVERPGFATDLYLKTKGTPATEANKGSLYGSGGGSPVGVYRDSAGTDVPLVLGGARWEQTSQVQWSSPAMEPYAPPANPHPTGLYVDPPAGEVVLYTIGAYQMLIIPATVAILGAYGEQELGFDNIPGTASDRFLGPAFVPDSGPILYTTIDIAPDGEVIFWFDASAQADSSSVVMWLTITPARIYTV